MPKVATLAELNAYFARCDAKDDHRRVGQRVTTVADDFAVEQPLLRALPVEPFETGISLRPRVDRHARVTVRQCQYSVPVRYVGRQVRVLLRATQVLVFDGPRLVTTHERSTIRGSVTLVLDHYLEVLAYKPGALPGATALVQARGEDVGDDVVGVAGGHSAHGERSQLGGVAVEQEFQPVALPSGPLMSHTR